MMQDVFEKLQFDSEKYEVFLKYEGYEIRVRDPIKIIFNGDFKSHCDDCLPVAISLFFNRPYDEVYRELTDEAISQRELFNTHEIAKRYLTGMGLEYHDIMNKYNTGVSLWDFIRGYNNWLYYSDTLFLTDGHAFVVRDGIICVVTRL